jgi:uncharacterized protein (TIGR02246 family)
MPAGHEAFIALCQFYARAVNASDSVAYAKLFAQDAIRMPPGTEPEYGSEAIQRSEQADYDVARWDVNMTPRDILPVADDWVYGIGDVDVSTVAHSDGATSNFRLTATWLLQRQSSGEWLIKRQMWNRKPDRA